MRGRVRASAKQVLKKPDLKKTGPMLQTGVEQGHTGLVKTAFRLRHVELNLRKDKGDISCKVVFWAHLNSSKRGLVNYVSLHIFDSNITKGVQQLDKLNCPLPAKAAEVILCGWPCLIVVF